VVDRVREIVDVQRAGGSMAFRVDNGDDVILPEQRKLKRESARGCHGESKSTPVTISVT